MRHSGHRIFVALLLLAVTPAARANDGILDPTCGSGGAATADIFGSTSSHAAAMAVQADGRIVVAGFVREATDDFILARYNVDGTLDAAFGSRGIVTTDFFGRPDRALAVAIQGDGKIVAAGFAARPGTQRDFALARYNGDGSLDPSFGTGGKVTTDFYGRFDRAYAIAIQADGRIVAAGLAFNPGTGANEFALARYETNGSLDAGFGVGGEVTTVILGHDDEAGAVAIQADGKIVAGGSALVGGLNYDFALARYDGTDGSPDVGFGTGGVVLTDFSGGDDRIAALAIQTDGKIVAGGQAFSSVSLYDFGLARYRAADGSLDPSFGSGGRVTTDFAGETDQIRALRIQSGGQILAAGVSVNSSENSDMALAQYDPFDGSLDATFGSAGKLTTDFAGSLDETDAVAFTAGRVLAVGVATNAATGRDLALARYYFDGTPDTAWGYGGRVTTDLTASTPQEALAAAIQADGKAVVAGWTAKASVDFVLARFRFDGSLDTTFGSGGLVVTDFWGSWDQATAVLVQPDGRIVAAGFVFDAASSAFHFGLARYLSDGSLDPTFGTGGRVVTGLRGFDDEALALALQADGRIVAAGTSADPATGTYAFAVARYNPDGSLDASFGNGGFVTTSVFGVDDEALAVAIQSDQKIVVAGRVLDGGPKFGLARYNPGGTLDTAFGTGGVVVTSFFGNDDEAFAVAIQADQKIVAGGFATDAAPDFALARYTTNGSLDASFGSGGLVAVALLGDDDEGFALKIQPDQKIVLAGMASFQFAVARFSADGTFDTTFGTGGFVTTSLGGLNDQALAVALHPDGRIVAAGFATTAGTGSDLALVRYFVCGFRDIADSQFHEDICSVAQAGISAGCGEGNYCPDSSVTRAQMAVFLLKAEHGIGYVPPACHGAFPDVPCPGLFADWIEQLAAEGITAGCGGGNYCPGSAVTRAQMSAFLLRTEHGPGYSPPTCAGVFGDVTCPSQFAAWIEALYGEAVTGGCQASPLLYCPDNPVKRGQMAVFLRKTFGLTPY